MLDEPQNKPQMIKYDELQNIWKQTCPDCCCIFDLLLLLALMGDPTLLHLGLSSGNRASSMNLETRIKMKKNISLHHDHNHNGSIIDALMLILVDVYIYII